MRYTIKTILLLFVLGCAVNASAQRVDPTSKGTPIEDGKIVTEYFASEGVTFVRLNNLFLYKRGVAPGQIMKDWLNMMAWGQKVKTQKSPSYIMLGFASSSEKGCTFPNSLEFEITFVADGELIKIGSVFSFNEPATDGSCTESIMAKMPYSTFVIISRAKKVELRIADLKIEMTELHLKVLRNFVTQIS